jgi:solute:Na+ symporter, SSS family
LQLLGGIWISQTIPSVIVGLYTRWLNPWALIIGWAAGLVSGTWMAASLSFQSAVFPLAIDGLIVLSLLLNPIGATRGADQTTVTDYHL